MRSLTNGRESASRVPRGVGVSPRVVRSRMPVLLDADLTLQFGDAGFDQVIDYCATG
jgi:hypothetical protein